MYDLFEEVVKVISNV